MTQPKVAIYGIPPPFNLSSMASYLLLVERGFKNIEKHRVDNNPAEMEEMFARTGKKSVPQIFIGDRYVGGRDELLALDASGELAKLLH